jgi:hypothetical protein
LLFYLDLLVDFIPGHCVQLAHDLLVHLQVELAVINCNKQLGVTTSHGALDARFNLEIKTLDVLAYVDELAQLAIELLLAVHVVLGAALTNHTLADFQDSLVHDSFGLFK